MSSLQQQVLILRYVQDNYFVLQQLVVIVAKICPRWERRNKDEEKEEEEEETAARKHILRPEKCQILSLARSLAYIAALYGVLVVASSLAGNS